MYRIDSVIACNNCYSKSRKCRILLSIVKFQPYTCKLAYVFCISRRSAWQSPAVRNLEVRNRACSDCIRQEYCDMQCSSSLEIGKGAHRQPVQNHRCDARVIHSQLKMTCTCLQCNIHRRSGQGMFSALPVSNGLHSTLSNTGNR